MLGVGAEELLGAVFVIQFKHRTESALAPYHTLVAGRSHDFVSPPAGRHLGGKLVQGAGAFAISVRNVVGISYFRLLEMREAGLEDLTAHDLAVQVQFIHAQAGGHPGGAGHFAGVRHRRNEPAGAVRGTVVLLVTDCSGDHGSVGSGNPLRALPGIISKRVGQLPDRCFRSFRARDKKCRRERCKNEKTNDSFHNNRLRNSYLQI